MVNLKKRGDFNFVWLFAVIAGTAVLILAIIGAVRYGKTTSNTQDSEVAKALSLITEPMQAGFASGKKSTIKFKKDTLIDNVCFADGFGFNEISVMTLERANSDFEMFGTSIRVTNKYFFFSEHPGKNFYILSFPIHFAFRVADAIIMDSREYCFIGIEEFEGIRKDLAIIGSQAQFGHMNCTEESIRVCFSHGTECDITVLPRCTNPRFCNNEFEVGIVEKDGNSLEYAGNLLYPAIFSSSDDYLCNVKRFLYRQSILANLYIEKSSYMSSRNCNSNLGIDLRELEEVSFDASTSLSSGDLGDIYFATKLISEKEADGQCRLWS